MSKKVIIGILLASVVLCGCHKKPQATTQTATRTIAPGDDLPVDTAPTTDEKTSSTPIESKKLIDVGVVQFDFDSDVIRSNEAKGILLMAKGECVITGHTCIIGTEDYNFNLGMRRAGALMEWLEDHGSHASFRIESKGESEAMESGLIWKDRKAVVRCR